jgi:hypothetical protein
MYRAAALLILVPAALCAQVASEEVPLKNWQAAAYWQPTPVEEQASAANPDADRNAGGMDDSAPGSGPLVFVGITPCRLVDTRATQRFSGAFGPPSLSGTGRRTIPLRSSATCAIPAIAQAYSLNVTRLPRVPLGFIKVLATGQTLPGASNALSSTPGFLVNGAFVALAGTDGSVDVYASAPTDLILDINGFYVPAAALLPADRQARERAQGASGDEGAEVFASRLENAPLASGGAEAAASSSANDASLAGQVSLDALRAGDKSMTFNGLTNSITVDSAVPPLPSKPNELYIGGDNGSGAGAIPFSKIKVGIGTRDTSGGAKLKIFDPSSPGIELNSGPARLLLNVATCTTCFSTVASPGDAIVSANSGGSEDLILAARNGNQGAIRFTTGQAHLCGDPDTESQKMVLTNAGNLGIGPNFTTGQFCGGPQQVTERLDVDGRARIRNLPPGNTLTNVVVATPQGVLSIRPASTLGVVGPQGPQGPAGPQGPQGPAGAAGDPADDWVRAGGNMFPFDLTDNVGVGTNTPTGRLHVVQTAPALAGDQFALRVQNSSTVSNGQRVGIEVQNTGPLGGFKDDVGIWVRTVNGSSDVHANMAAVLDGNVAIGTLSIGNQEIGTQGKYVLSMKDGSAPITPPSAYQGIQLWSQSGELRVMDAALHVTTLSPHNFSMMPASEPMAWSFYSENPQLHKKISVDMLRLTRVVERISGERLALIRDLDDASKEGAADGVEAVAAGDLLDLRAELLGAKNRLAALEAQIASLKAMLIKSGPR